MGAEYSADHYKAVQAQLNKLGANPQLIVDGAWGPKSKETLKAFQRSRGLTIDGIPGPKTSAALGLTSSASSSTASLMGSAIKPASDSDRKAYAIAKSAVAKGLVPGMTEAELQYVLSVAKGEGAYGNGWSYPSQRTIERSKKFGLTGYEGSGSNNWGAVQGKGSAGSFYHVDSNAKGEDYKGTYKRYATPEEGFVDMARLILGGGPIRKEVGSAAIRAAINKGNLREAVYAQHANKYFELDPEKYLSAIKNHYQTLQNGLGWPKLLDENGLTTAGKAAAGLGTVLTIGAGILLFKFFTRGIA